MAAVLDERALDGAAGADVCRDGRSGVEPEGPLCESLVGELDGRAGAVDPERPLPPEGVACVLELLGLGPCRAGASAPREGA